jgi:hypothetical protein
MTSIGHIMIGATITAVFSIYTILNICEYVTTHVLETEKNLIIYYDYKIKELNKTIDLLTEKVNLLESNNNNDEEQQEKDIDICDIYDSEPLDFSCEQLQLLLGEKVVVEDVVEESDKSDSDIVVEDVVEEQEEINEYNNIPDLVELDNTDDVKRVKDSLLVIARKILIGV